MCVCVCVGNAALNSYDTSVVQVCAVCCREGRNCAVKSAVEAAEKIFISKLYYSKLGVPVGTGLQSTEAPHSGLQCGVSSPTAFREGKQTEDAPFKE